MAGAWFEEEITECERRLQYSYRVLRSRPGRVREDSQLEFVRCGQGVTIAWSANVEVDLPLVRWASSMLFAAAMSKFFGRGLDSLADLAAAPDPA